jgi:glycosyltransferase involved in cell wall biosynthesis
MLAIVIPAYKRPECLRQALESLTVQTNKKFFVVVVDDASPEPLEPVVKEFENKLRIRYLRQEENGGPGVARQTGLDFVHKHNIDLIMFMDSDDMLFPNAVDRLTREINRSMQDVISSGIWAESKQGHGNSLHAKNRTWTHGKIYRVKYLIDNDIRFPTLRTNEDLAFNLKATLASKKIGYLEETLYLFRDEQNSITRNKANQNYKIIFSTDYIGAIYDAVRYFLNKNQEIPQQLIVDIFGLFNSYQVGLCVYGTLPQHTIDQTKELIQLPQIQHIIQNPKLISEYARLFKQIMKYEKELFWFPQTLKDWIKEMSE